jgi:signal transduction histidine kinase
VNAGTSFRSRLLVGSVIWTIGVLLVVSMVLVVFLAGHPRPHAVVLGWFLAAPAALVVVVGAGCLVAGALQIRRGLSAVDELRAHLAAVRRGDAAQLPGTYPSEIQPLVDDLNGLLADRALRIERAVATAADLAHGLKTPLAVLSRDAQRATTAGDMDLAESITGQIDRMRRQIDYHLAGARASASAHTPGVACALAPAIAGLVRTLERLHADRGLHFEQDVPRDHTARCSREDVEEMLGNLLDNACKWGRSRVRVASTMAGSDVVLTVDDDGPGLDPSMEASVIGRGVRADERVPGSGLGLAIVRQLVELYGGALVLSRSPLGGLRAQLTLRAASAA